MLLRLLVAEKQCSCGYSSQKNSAPAVTRRRLCAPSSARLSEEETASAQVLENSVKSRPLLLRLLVAEKQRSCGYASQTMCSFLCKIKRRRDCVGAGPREFGEESPVAPAITRRRKTVLLRVVGARNDMLLRLLGARKDMLLRLLVADYVLLPLQD
ncbi:hypothetical protein [Evansella halocellulosilytica]|uniref:hypothetical protein n=1 Tax=Evansella halocellulosilytica TaxID=2011013 RepID=UPI000BB959AB|nr:hypothetical protein [Evansella halocellulosilytica]